MYDRQFIEDDLTCGVKSSLESISEQHDLLKLLLENIESILINVGRACGVRPVLAVRA